jgi:hypothetical protein
MSADEKSIEQRLHETYTKYQTHLDKQTKESNLLTKKKEIVATVLHLLDPGYIVNVSKRIDNVKNYLESGETPAAMTTLPRAESTMFSFDLSFGDTYQEFGESPLATLRETRSTSSCCGFFRSVDGADVADKTDRILQNWNVAVKDEKDYSYGSITPYSSET